MNVQIAIKNSFEIIPGKYLLVTNSSPVLPIQKKHVFPVSVTYQIGRVKYEGHIILAHFQFNEIVKGFWPFQREYLLFAVPGQSFVGQIIDAIDIKNG